MNFKLQEPPINIREAISVKSFEMIQAEAVEYEGFEKFDENGDLL